MKKLSSILVILILFLCGISCVKAANYDYYCTREAASQLAKIIYKEAGADSAINDEDNFFMKLSTAAVSINNANSKSGNSFYEKIYNLTDGNYDGYSAYKDVSFESVVPSSKRGEVLYIAELVLTGRYTFPTNMTLQASQSVVERYGTVWASVSNKDEFKDIYFGYEQANLNTTDIYNKKIDDNSVAYYKNLATNLKNVDYSTYALNNVCSGYVSTIVPSTPDDSSDSTTPTTDREGFAACVNPDILRVIYFFMIIIDIVKIIVPIALIVFGLIDFSKAVVTTDDKVQKKSVTLFIKRILYASLIFIVPWIIEVLMVTLGNLIGDTQTVNFTDCLENANAECIDALDSKDIDKIKSACDYTDDVDLRKCYVCDMGTNGRMYRTSEDEPDEFCINADGWVETEFSATVCDGFQLLPDAR